MADNFQGDINVARGLIFGGMTTPQRLGYTPTENGTFIYDLTEKTLYKWQDNEWQREEALPSSVKYKLYAIVGDSTGGRGSYDTSTYFLPNTANSNDLRSFANELDPPNDFVYQVNSDGFEERAQHTLPFRQYTNAKTKLSDADYFGQLGFGLSFGKEWVKQGNLKSNERILILHLAVPGSGFNDGGWRVYGSTVASDNGWHYLNATKRIKSLLENPSIEMGGVIACFGSNDTGQLLFQTDIDNFHDNFGNDIGLPDVKIAYVDMVKQYYAADPSANATQIANRTGTRNELKSIVDRKRNAGFADTATLELIKANPDNDINHRSWYNNINLGKRIVWAFNYAEANVQESIAPDKVHFWKCYPQDSGFRVRIWHPLTQVNALTQLNVYYKLSTDTVYTSVPVTGLVLTDDFTTYELTGLTNGLEYDIYVTAENSVGESQASSIQSGTPLDTYASTVLHWTGDFKDLSDESGNGNDWVAAHLGGSGHQIDQNIRYDYYLIRTLDELVRFTTTATMEPDSTVLVKFFAPDYFRDQDAIDVGKSATAPNDFISLEGPGNIITSGPENEIMHTLWVRFDKVSGGNGSVPTGAVNGSAVNSADIGVKDFVTVAITRSATGEIAIALDGAVSQRVTGQTPLGSGSSIQLGMFRLGGQNSFVGEIAEIRIMNATADDTKLAAITKK